MQIAIVHYHLQPGGVRKIIEDQVKILKQKKISVAIVTGYTPLNYRIGTKIIQEPSLNYLPRAIKKKEINNIYSKLYDFFIKNFSKKTIFHCHNLNLGKNPILTMVMFDLMNSGYNVVNHCHDFAEDERSQNYIFLMEIVGKCFNHDLSSVMYPNSVHYKFLIINSKDKKWFPETISSKVSLLENPVNMSKNKTMVTDVFKDLKISEQLPLFVYPVRVIRRKNIGELLLFSALFYDEANWAITLAPHNPIELQFYANWVQFSFKHNLPVIFEASNKTDFSSLIHSSFKIINVSRKEGFGLAYLEPWLINKEVVGRNIDEITNDFKNRGISFPNFYSNIKIPEPYQTDDFVNLSYEEQQSVIQHTIIDSNFKENIIDLNNLRNILFNDPDQNMITKNKSIIENEYSLESFGGKLVKLYKEFVRK